MKKKKFYKESGQMDLSDRIAIETGLSLGESFTVIGKRLGRHPSTISHEVKENRTYIPSTYPGGKDCWNARKCTAKCICGCGPKVCHYLCKYCKDPMASWQKPHIEKNHEFIRYVLPRGKSLDPYDQKDITLLMNHINSIRRPSLDNKAPYELIQPEDKDMWALAELLKMNLIPPDEVHLKADLFRRNK